MTILNWKILEQEKYEIKMLAFLVGFTSESVFSIWSKF